LPVGKLSADLILDGKLLSKNAKVGAENPSIGPFGAKSKFWGRVKIMSTDDLFCRKYPTFCQNSVGILQCVGKLQLPVQSYFTVWRKIGKIIRTAIFDTYAQLL